MIQSGRTLTLKIRFLQSIHSVVSFCSLHQHRVMIKGRCFAYIYSQDLIIVESMKGTTIEVTKKALIEALAKLDQEDSFGIMVFNNETHLYSRTLESTINESIKNATEWITANFIASGGTNTSNALLQALDMFSGTSKSIPMVFFITDGAVESERQICEVI